MPPGGSQSTKETAIFRTQHSPAVITASTVSTPGVCFGVSRHPPISYVQSPLNCPHFTDKETNKNSLLL